MNVLSEKKKKKKKRVDTYNYTAIIPCFLLVASSDTGFPYKLVYEGVYTQRSDRFRKLDQADADQLRHRQGRSSSNNYTLSTLRLMDSRV